MAAKKRKRARTTRRAGKKIVFQTEDEPELTEQQERFCREYVIDFNGARAARDSGYSAKTADQQASRMLRIVKVQERIAEIIGPTLSDLNVTQQTAIARVARLALASLGDVTATSPEGLPELAHWDELTPEQKAMISGLKVRRIVRGTGKNREVETQVDFKLEARSPFARMLLDYFKIAPRGVVTDDRNQYQYTLEDLFRIAAGEDG